MNSTLLFVIFSDYVSYINLPYGVIGGLLASSLGWSGKNDTIRWTASFALIGIFGAYVFWYYRGTNELMFLQEIHTFVPLFAVLGLLWSGIFKYQIEDADWPWLVVFPLVGVVAAALSQSRGAIPWLFVLGVISGGVAWLLANPRLRWALLFAGLSVVLVLALFTVGYSRAYNFSVISLGAIVGGVAGWFAQNQTLRWTVALAMLGTLAGAIAEAMYLFWGLWPILIGGTIGGVAGLIIRLHRYRELLTLMVLGGMFFCSIKWGWDTMQFLEALWRMP